jgi:hypothetical protein
LEDVIVRLGFEPLSPDDAAPEGAALRPSRTTQVSDEAPEVGGTA